MTPYVELTSSFLHRGGEDIGADYERFDREFRAILAWPPARVPDIITHQRCIEHGGAYVFWKWDPRAKSLQGACSEAIKLWCGTREVPLDLVCPLFELSYFLAWCFNDSNLVQAALILPDMRRLALRVGVPSRGTIERRRAPATIVYLTRIADLGTAVGACLKPLAEAVLSAPEKYRLLVHVWDRIEPETAAWLASRAVPHVVLKGSTPSETIENVADRAARDAVDVVLTDMNNAVPTVLYAKRIAPVQIMLQIGLPAWGTLNLDAVYNGFGFDPALGGWGLAQNYEFLPPWDLDALRGQPAEAEIAAQRAGIPAHLRVIGSYARLVKFSLEYLRAAERILLAHPDVCLLLGGTGNAAMIEDFVRHSPVGDRMAIRCGFVPGRAWARILTLFLDTWPFSGGGSFRECGACGVPVVSMHSPEMPGMDRERDPDLIAADWQAFSDHAIALLGDEALYREAQSRAFALAARMADAGRFRTRFLADLDHALDRALEGPLAPMDAG